MGGNPEGRYGRQMNIWDLKRVNDEDTLAGNAHTGNSGDVNGGDVVNMADNFGMPTLMDVNSNNAGTGGGSVGGCAIGGHSNSKGNKKDNRLPYKLLGS